MDNIFIKKLDRINIGVEKLNKNASKINQRFGLGHPDMNNQHLDNVQEMNLTDKLNRVEIGVDMLYKYLEKCLPDRLNMTNQHSDTVQFSQEMTDDNIILDKLSRIEKGVEILNKIVSSKIDDTMNQCHLDMTEKRLDPSVQYLQEMDDNILLDKLNRIEIGVETLNKKVLKFTRILDQCQYLGVADQGIDQDLQKLSIYDANF